MTLEAKKDGKTWGDYGLCILARVAKFLAILMIMYNLRIFSNLKVKQGFFRAAAKYFTFLNRKIYIENCG